MGDSDRSANVSVSEAVSPRGEGVTGPPSSLSGGPPDGRLHPEGWLPSFRVDPTEFLRRTGLPLNPKILQLAPQGSRILVLLNPTPKTYEGLHIPDAYRQSEKMGSGWVIAAGPYAGTTCPHPGGPMCQGPEDLLYTQILFGSHSGKIIRVEFLDRQDRAPYIILTDRDVWFADLNPSEHLPVSKEPNE